MNIEIFNKNSSQILLSLLFSLIFAVISTLFIYLIDMLLRLQGMPLFSKLRLIVAFWEEIEMKNQLFSPLTFYQFYSVLFIVVLGFIVGLMFYKEAKEVIPEEISELQTKMSRKKLKKAKKAQSRER